MGHVGFIEASAFRHVTEKTYLTKTLAAILT